MSLRSTSAKVDKQIHCRQFSKISNTTQKLPLKLSKTIPSTLTKKFLQHFHKNSFKPSIKIASKLSKTIPLKLPKTILLKHQKGCPRVHKSIK